MPREALFASDWLVPEERREELGILKTGKESEVHLVARHGDGRRLLIAEKHFVGRDRRMFRDDSLYRGVWGEGTRREHRAMKRNTRFGHEVLHRSWIAHEWETLVRLHRAGATVPPPADLLEDGYSMAFIGDGTFAAPRLADVRLDTDTAARVWDDLLGEIAIFVAAERVHGDLSAYNVLWWRERAVVIDFSQAVDVVTHPAARDLVERDLRSLAVYFRRRGVDVDLTRALARVGADARRFTRQVS